MGQVSEGGALFASFSLVFLQASVRSLALQKSPSCPFAWQRLVTRENSPRLGFEDCLSEVAMSPCLSCHEKERPRDPGALLRMLLTISSASCHRTFGGWLLLHHHLAT
mmetsp:Transcript_24498/g.53287  ORF Transcript_24498/g.53287 Transcript_24498/m.53287 type:complete len:108 (-) Transcript_24498:1175-1498(-)